MEGFAQVETADEATKKGIEVFAFHKKNILFYWLIRKLIDF